MTFCRTSLKTVSLVFFVVLISLVAFSAPAHAGIPNIVVKVSDTTAPSGTQGSIIAIYLDNLVDTVAAFNLWLQLDVPDIMTLDTLLDTVGTLCGGWDIVRGTSISGTNRDLNIFGLAHYLASPGGIAPQQGGLLIKVLANVMDMPDTTTRRTVNILVQTDFKDHFSLSRPDGTSIPWIQENRPDTNCYLCEGWIGDVCVNWVHVTFGPCDSTSIDTIQVAVLDTAHVKVYDGSLTVLEPPAYTCGNIDGDAGQNVDISDLIYLVEYMFGSGPAPDPFLSGDVNCDGTVDISDVIAMVDYMFGVGAAICPNNCM
jgi:hypothetical protein